MNFYSYLKVVFIKRMKLLFATTFVIVSCQKIEAEVLIETFYVIIDKFKSAKSSLHDWHKNESINL